MERAKKKQNILVRAVGRLRGAYSALSDRHYTTVAGTLVFFLTLSFVPLLFWLAFLFGKTSLYERLFDLELFDWARELLVYLSSHAQGATAGANILFLGTTLWSGTGFFYHLQRSGEIIYGVTHKKQGWKLRIFATVFAFLTILYFAFAGAALVGAQLLTEWLPKALSLILVYTPALAFGFFGAWIMNAYACPYRASPADTAGGSVITAVGWLGASVLFGVYLNFINPHKLYGALAAVIVFLLFLYWLMICFVAGVIFNVRRVSKNAKNP